jgi:hypothetical protein
MKPGGYSTLQRYFVACLAASLVTIAILFVMTQLIAPIGGHPVVKQMIQRLELHHRPPAEAPNEVQNIKLPPKPRIIHAPDMAIDEGENSKRPEVGSNRDNNTEVTQDQAIDWWAEVQKYIQGSEDAGSQKWMLSHGFKKYVSIMQGPMPSSGGPSAPPEKEEVGSSHRNVYGDLEIKVTENCILQVSSNIFDSSDFARHIPPRILCTTPPKIDMSGLELSLNKH